ncbi:MAG: DUF2062 domain-containing protein [Oleiphilaceae bacterium]|nr:DUF2062 domain-containing protein [Oleiphilaceae bacterium]
MRWFRFQLLTFIRRQRWQMRLWLQSHPRITAFLERTGSLHVDEQALARGAAMGLFIGLTPTVGVQTLLMLAGAVLLRANFPAAYLLSFVSNPLTMGPLYYGFHETGEALLRAVPLIPPESGPVMALGEEIMNNAMTTLLGSLLIATPAAMLGYAVAYRMWRLRQARVQARRMALAAKG